MSTTEQEAAHEFTALQMYVYEMACIAAFEPPNDADKRMDNFLWDIWNIDPDVLACYEKSLSPLEAIQFLFCKKTLH